MRHLIFSFFVLVSFQIIYAQNNRIHKSGNIKITLDGKVEESFWNQSKMFSGFKQEYPDLGNPATEKTEVFLVYDDENIYAAFKCFQSGSVYGSVLERDQGLDVDDYVEIVIDSRNDYSNSLSFQTNVLSTRTDIEISDNGTVFNRAWNTFWNSKSALTDYGWSAEFVIPLSSLRYEEDLLNRMRFKFIRNIKTKNEIIIYPLLVANTDKPKYNLVNSIELVFENLPIKNPVYFIPYLITNVSQSSSLNSGGDYYKETNFLNRKYYSATSGLDKVLSNIGFDLKYKINNSSTLDLTLNTDFAQAEADDRIINLTRYSISLPEKRSFFLENAELFNSSMFDHRLFHSRRIGIEGGYNIPIIGGIRFAGSAGGFEYGLMNLQSNGLDDQNLDAKNFTVFRLKNSFIGDESYLGGIFTNKSSTEKNDFNRLAGVDGFYRFGKSITSNFFAATSFNNGRKEFRNNAFGLRINRFPQQGFEFDLRFREYQENFNPELGFLPRPNSRRLTLRGGYRLYFTNSSFLSRLVIGNYNTFYWISSTNEKEFFQINPFIISTFKDGSTMVLYTPLYQEDKLFSPWKFSQNITIPKNKYIMKVWDLTYYSSVANDYNWSANISYSNFYGGNKFSFAPSVNYIFSKNFNAEIYIDYNRISFPQSFSNNDKTVETQVLYSAKLNYFFSSSLSLKAFVQYDNLSKSVGSNLRLRYNPDEGTNFYLVFNQNINTERQRYSPEKPFIDNQTLILKYSQTFIF